MSTIEACARSAEVRTARKLVKRSLTVAQTPKAARLAAADLICNPPPEIERMRVRDLLGACKGMGDTAVRRYMDAALVSGGASVGGLAEGCRDALVAALSAPSLPGPADPVRALGRAERELSRLRDEVRTLRSLTRTLGVELRWANADADAAWKALEERVG